MFVFNFFDIPQSSTLNLFRFVFCHFGVDGTIFISVCVSLDLIETRALATEESGIPTIKEQQRNALSLTHTLSLSSFSYTRTFLSLSPTLSLNVAIRF